MGRRLTSRLQSSETKLLSHASNLGNPWRRLVLLTQISDWTPTNKQRLMNPGERLIKHAWYYRLLLASVILNSVCLW